MFEIIYLVPLVVFWTVVGTMTILHMYTILLRILANITEGFRTRALGSNLDEINVILRYTAVVATIVLFLALSLERPWYFRFQGLLAMFFSGMLVPRLMRW